jgi:hypothetical protein
MTCSYGILRHTWCGGTRAIDSLRQHLIWILLIWILFISWTLLLAEPSTPTIIIGDCCLWICSMIYSVLVESIVGTLEDWEISISLPTNIANVVDSI